MQFSIQKIYGLRNYSRRLCLLPALSIPPAYSKTSENVASFSQDLDGLTKAFGTQNQGGNSSIITIEKPQLPLGDYTLCKVDPRTIYLNMVGSQPLSRAVVNRSGQMWSAYIQLVKEYYDKISTQNVSHLTQMEAAANLDQAIRKAIGDYGLESAESEQAQVYQASLWAVSCLIDRYNTILAREMLEKTGWPGGGRTPKGKQSSLDMFLLFQHAVFDDSEMPNLMKIVEKAWSKRIIEPFEYARLKDRYTERQFNYQLYGTSTAYESGGPLIDHAEGCLEDLNNRRRVLGIKALEPKLAVKTREGKLCPVER
ncbi:MAG: hypothetical protein ABI240_16495 [Sphingomonas sp.]